MLQLRPGSPLVLVFAFVLVLVSGACGKVIPDEPDAGIGGDGSADLCPTMNCDDGDACTLDSCAANACVHAPAHGQQVFSFTGTIQMFTPNMCMRALTI